MEGLKSKINIRYFASLREITGKREEELELKGGVSVEELLQHLSNKYGDRFREYVFKNKLDKPRENLQFLVNGKSITTMNGIKTKIHGDCQFAIIPPVGGGSASPLLSIC